METLEAAPKIRPTTYQSEEVLGNFRALLADADMERELEILKIGRLNIFRRKKAALELTALYIALWKLVLNKSFPNDATLFYQEYIEETYLKPDGDTIKPATKAFLEIVSGYISLLEQAGDTDFTAVAKHLVERLVKEPGEHKETEMRFILIIRNTYKSIFDKLI